VRQTIDADVVSGLKACGVSLDTALQAAWWLLISRITGQSGFVAGWQHDCRRDYEALADTVGALEEAFPVAFRAEDDDVVGAVLTRLAAMLDNHREAQEFWRSETLSGHAMPLIGFGMRNLPPVIEKDGLRWEARQVPGPFERFELALDVGISDGQPVEAAVYHVPQFYSGVAAERLLEQYLTVLSGLPGHMKKPVGDLPVAGQSEQDRCLAMNDTALALRAETILEQFAGQVARQPDAAALSDRGETWSYLQLDARVRRLARQLRRHGVGTESRVALLMPRSANLIVALWAVLRAGGSYVPLDPAWPEGRRLAILADAAPRVVLTTEDLMLVQCPDGMAFLDVAELLEGVGSTGAEMQGDLDAPADIIPEQVAYVLYTSGSTGKPKGVVVEHRHLMNYVAAVSEALGLDECRRFALTSSVAADLGNTALFGAFHNGGCLFVADDDAMADGASFAKFLAEQNIDCLKIVPSHLAALLDTDLSALPRTLVLGGEPTSWSLVDAIHARDPACRIHNHYGPTEATVGVMVHSVVPDALRQGDGPHLERVLGNCRVYLLDPARRLVPVGALGELYIGGAQVCRGYLDQTDSPAFVADPFVPGDRLYRTGDLGRYLPEGGLQIVGRADAQVKIRGFRVEPAEVETVLLSAPGVGQAAVRTFGEGDQIQLVAYVVPCPGMDEQSCSEYLLKEHARNLLTDAMVPARVMILSAFPRLANGKIDRQALPEPDTKDTEKHYVAPRDAVEAVLAGLIAELLERERVSVEESFFDLGGHSLLVIKLVARLRKLLQVEAEPGIVFDHPSVAALAQALRDAETTPGRLEKVAGLRQRIAAMSEEERAAILLKNAFPADGKVA
jgi:amino acid adenylation domain-containing protein